MPFVKGKSGNPNGRPKKDRALTDLLERAGSATVEYQGKNISGKRLMALQVWQGITTGVVQFPGGKMLQLSPQDWKDFVKWAYSHIDGPPTARVDLTSKYERLDVLGVQFVDYRSGIAEAAPGPTGDSDAPSQDKSPGDGSPVG